MSARYLAPLWYISTVDELAELAGDGEPLVLCCYEDWCPASSQSKPVFERLAALADGKLRFGKARTDMSPDVAQALQLTAIPSFFLFLDAQLQDVLRGSVDEQTLIDWLHDRLLGALAT